MSQSVVIGIDGGGTKTAISCLELSTKTVLARATKPSTNWNSVGIAVAKQNLQDGIEEVLILSKTSKDQGKIKHFHFFFFEILFFFFFKTKSGIYLLGNEWSRS